MRKFLMAFVLVLPVCAVAYTTVFKSNLYLGVTSPEVLELQRLLNSSLDTQVSPSGLGSKGFETTYFGEKTKSAVIKFQEKYKNEILVPAGLASGNGFVGLLTRKKLNDIYNILHATSTQALISTTTDRTIYASNLPKAQIYSTSTPVITGVFPTYWQDNQAVRVIGTGFTASNTIVISIEPQFKYTGYASESLGTVIPFTLSTGAGASLANSLNKLSPNVRGYVIQHIMKTYRNANNLGDFNQDGIYTTATVRIRNENGLSDPYKVYINLLRN